MGNRLAEGVITKRLRRFAHELEMTEEAALAGIRPRGFGGRGPRHARIDHMATWHHCWRCQMRIPMLDEQEWDLIHPLLTASIRAIQAYREKHGATLAEALKAARTDAACAKFRELTGFTETNAIWHQRSIYGPPCTRCGELLRTPRSRRCVSCGLPAGEEKSDREASA